MGAARSCAALQITGDHADWAPSVGSVEKDNAGGVADCPASGTGATFVSVEKGPLNNSATATLSNKGAVTLSIAS